LARHLFVEVDKGFDVSGDQTCGCKFHGLILSSEAENGSPSLRKDLSHTPADSILAAGVSYRCVVPTDFFRSCKSFAERPNQ
jgi:hypothetical protein